MKITLHDCKATAVIDSMGAQLISLTDASAKEYIWQRDPQFWSRCSPLLFPIVGNCRNNQTILEGHIFSISKHGFARDMEFTVSFHSETKAVFEIKDTADTRKIYPCSFRLSLTYTLENGILSLEYMVENTDNKTIYYCLGAHPAFNCPAEEGAAFEDYDLVFEKEETASSIFFDSSAMCFVPDRRIPRLEHSFVLPLNRSLFKDDALYFDQLKSKSVSLVNRNTGRGVCVSFPGFETLAFWTPYPAKAPFVCIEPWNGSAVYNTENDEFIHKNHVQSLLPKASKSYRLAIRILES